MNRSTVGLATAAAVTLVLAASAAPKAIDDGLSFAGVRPAAPAQAEPGGSGWSADARHLRGRDYQRFLYECPAGGGPQTVWGTDVYTDDSSVCTAAVHAGRITLTQGGTVTIEIRPGQSSYTASTRNGITSRSYGSWSGSFAVIAASTSVCAAPRSCIGGGGWGADTRHLRGRIGERFTFTCPAGGTPRTVWGSGPYTDDSSVCTAGVHAGKITLARGGTVLVEIRPGRSAYTASTRRGITTRRYGAWQGSFVVVGAPGGVTSTSWTGTWSTNWGSMTLTQTGSSVSGSYAHDGGQIAGTASGLVLKGRWSEQPSRQPPNDAGDLEFTMSADGKSFTGRWRYGYTGAWSSDSWTGTRG